MSYISNSIASTLPGPIVIGGTGGSGTRTVAKILLKSGIYLGAQLNESHDTLMFARFYRTRHIELFRQLASARVNAGSDSCLELRHIINRLRLEVPENARGWGFKNPRSVYFLEILDRLVPDMKFIHVVRDGRDMAFSANQSSVEDYGPIIFKDEMFESIRHMSIALWSKINLQAALYSDQNLPARYLRVRFEDLCRRPGIEIRKILGFCDIECGNVMELVSGIHNPGSIERWKSKDATLVGEITRLGDRGLKYFGYVTGNNNNNSHCP